MREISFSVLTTHSTGQDDGTPLRYVTEAQLQHYKAMESAALAFAAALSVLAPPKKPIGRRAARGLRSSACRRLRK